MQPPDSRFSEDASGALSLLLVGVSQEDSCPFRACLRESTVEASLRDEEDLDAAVTALQHTSPDVLILHGDLLSPAPDEVVERLAAVAPEVPIVPLLPPDAPTTLRASSVPETVATEPLRCEELTPALVGRTLRWSVERSRLQARVRRRDAQVRSLKRSVEAGTLRATPDGHLDAADAALLQLLGAEQEEQITGLDLTALYTDPTHRGQTEAAEAPGGAEIEFERPDGSVLVGLLSLEPTRTLTGNVRHYDGTIVDITEQDEQADRLRILSKAVEHTSEAVIITEGAPLDPPGPRIRYVNEAFEQMTGYTEAELLGRTPRVLQGPETSEETLNGIREALEAGEKWQGETINYRKDGTPYVVEWNIAPVTGGDGTVEYWVSVQRDVTERRKRTERLRRQRNLLDQAQRLAGAWELDLRTRTQTWSDEVYRIFELDPSAEVGIEDAKTFFAADATSTLQRAIRRCAEEGQPYDLELPIRTANGNRRWIRTVGAPSETVDGEVVKVAGAIQDITERKRAEEALQARESQLRGITNSLPGVVFQAYARPGQEYGFYHVSEHAEDLMGISRDPADFFERCLARVPEAEQAALFTTIDEAVAAEAPLQFEAPFVRPSGETIWLLGTAMPEVRDDELVYNGVILDITGRKEAEQQLERATDLLRHAGDMAQLGGWSVDVSGEPPYQAEWTAGLYDLFELPRDEEPPTEEVFDYYHPEDRDRHRAAVEQALETGTGWNQEVRLTTAQGTERWVRNIGRTVTEDGEVVEIRGMIQDITEQKEAEEELRWTKRYYEQILNQVPIDLAVFSPDAEFEYLNPESVGDADMREWLRGRTNEDYCRKRGLNPALGRRRDAAIRKAARENEPVQFEETIDTGDGPRHYLRVHGPVTDLDGQLTNVVAFGLDITDRKKKEQHLREAKEEAERMNRLKSAFLANISHEIRTPLTSILGFAEAIGDEVGDGERPEDIDLDNLTQFSALIQQSGRRLMETLTGVLNLSRLEAGEMNLSATPVDLAAEAADAAAQFAPQAEEAGVELDAPTAPSPVWARADAGGLRIVLRNLLSNAIKYTQEGGEVEVRVRSDDEAAILAVDDTGIGMDPDATDQLFEAFKQASEGVGREYEGTGLGLTVTREVLDRMDATIEVETEKGEGSCFTVRLPRAEPAEQATSEAEATAGS